MNLTSEEREHLRDVFRMPSLQGISSRKSSITNAFVNALIPVVHPKEEEIFEALTLLGMDVDSVECAYCGDRATEWDHLRPLVVSRRPTGYFSEIGNLVPACGKCNQSKGNKQWEVWMRGSAKQSPASRAIIDLEERIARLSRFQAWKIRDPIDFEAVLGSTALATYWEHLDQVVANMEASQRFAHDLRAKIVASLDDR